MAVCTMSRLTQMAPHRDEHQDHVRRRLCRPSHGSERAIHSGRGEHERDDARDVLDDARRAQRRPQRLLTGVEVAHRAEG